MLIPIILQYILTPPIHKNHLSSSSNNCPFLRPKPYLLAPGWLDPTYRKRVGIPSCLHWRLARDARYYLFLPLTPCPQENAIERTVPKEITKINESVNYTTSVHTHKHIKGGQLPVNLWLKRHHQPVPLSDSHPLHLEPTLSQHPPHHLTKTHTKQDTPSIAMEKRGTTPQSSIQDEIPITIPGVKDPEKAHRDSEQELASTPALITDDEETSRPIPTEGDNDQPPKAQEKWNQNRTNMLRFFGVLYAFILLGMSDAALGVRQYSCSPHKYPVLLANSTV